VFANNENGWWTSATWQATQDYTHVEDRLTVYLAIRYSSDTSSWLIAYWCPHKSRICQQGGEG
jgi:hypothetical protein